MSSAFSNLMTSLTSRLCRPLLKPCTCAHPHWHSSVITYLACNPPWRVRCMFGPGPVVSTSMLCFPTYGSPVLPTSPRAPHQAPALNHLLPRTFSLFFFCVQRHNSFRETRPTSSSGYLTLARPSRPLPNSFLCSFLTFHYTSPLGSALSVGPDTPFLQR